MKKIRYLFILVAFILSGRLASAQETIITDISENYIARLVAISEGNYPVVKSNESKIEEAQDKIGQARVGYLNAFTFSYIYQPQGVNTLNGAGGNGNYSYFNGIQAGIFFNLGAFLTVPYAVKAARHELEIARYDQNTYFLTLTNQIRSRYYTYVGDIDILKFATQSSADAENVLKSIKNRFEKGEETFDTYTRAQTSLTASYQQKIQAETALLIAKANLEELLGEKLENVR